MTDEQLAWVVNEIMQWTHIIILILWCVALTGALRKGADDESR